MVTGVDHCTEVEPIKESSRSPFKSTFPFLCLPKELRNIIYAHALAYPSFDRDYHNHTLDGANEDDSTEDLSPRWSRLKLTTPTILLLNRQITSEALSVLHNAPLVIDVPPPGRLGNSLHLKCIEITDIISYRTLQAVPNVLLVMDLNFQAVNPSKADNVSTWSLVVETLLDIWSFRNCLERLTVKVDYIPLSTRAGRSFAEAGHHHIVVELLSKVGQTSIYSLHNYFY